MVNIEDDRIFVVILKFQLGDGRECSELVKYVKIVLTVGSIGTMRKISDIFSI